MDSYWFIPKEDSNISHHGVKGMKWGVRRYQNDDGSLTSLGKRREELQNAKKKGSEIQKRYAAREYRNEKTRQRINSAGYKKTKRQLANEKKFQDQGFTKDEAEVMAANRRRGVRIAAAIGTVAVASLVAYGAYKYHNRVADRIFAKGSELGRVAVNDDKALHEGFYAFRKGSKRDQSNYEGMYAKALKSRGNKVFRKTVQATSDIKIASERNAQRVLADMIKDDAGVRKAILNTAKPSTPAQKKLFKRATRDMNNGRYDSKNVYDLFNVGLDTRWSSPEMAETNKRFYDALKSRGYSAVRDVNDNRYSGYGSKDPLIFFDTSKVATTKVSELASSHIDQQDRKAIARLTVSELVKKTGPYVGIIAATKPTSNALRAREDRKMVLAYRKEHPKSKMTDSEILKTLKR